MIAVHRLQDQLQQTLALTKRRSYKTVTERATSVSTGNDAYAAMEAVTMAREWQFEGAQQEGVNGRKRPSVPMTRNSSRPRKPKKTYHDAIRRTLEKTEALEKHVKTVTMRSDSPAFNEADFFQTLIERQEEIIREINTLYGQLCQPRPTQVTVYIDAGTRYRSSRGIPAHDASTAPTFVAGTAHPQTSSATTRVVG